MDDKTKKKMQKEEEAIKIAAKEMEKREKALAKEAKEVASTGRSVMQSPRSSGTHDLQRLNQDHRSLNPALDDPIRPASTPRRMWK